MIRDTVPGPSQPLAETRRGRALYRPDPNKNAYTEKRLSHRTYLDGTQSPASGSQEFLPEEVCCFLPTGQGVQPASLPGDTPGCTWISAVMAAFKADSKPPSAIKLPTRRSIMNRRPGLTLTSLPETGKGNIFANVSEGNPLPAPSPPPPTLPLPPPPAQGRRAESARARSSAVGSSTDHPLCSTAWAAACTVPSTPALLARATTVCFRLLRRPLPRPKPSNSGSTWWLMAACN